MSIVKVHRGLALGALSLLVVGLVACGGSSTAQGKVATLTSNGNAVGLATTTTLSAKATQDAILAYAACMRTNGVAMKDPTFDANGQMTGGGLGRNSGIDRNSTAFKTAQTKCGDLIKGIGFGRGRRGNFDPAAMQAAFNDFTACLRDHGQNVKDITFGRPGGANGQGGNGQPGNSTPANGSIPPGGSVPPGGFDGPPGSRPNDNGNAPGGAGFNPATRLIERLGLDITDPTVKAAVDACQPIITKAFTPTTTTTAG